MFDKLFDFIAGVVGYFQFATTVDPFEGAVVLTLGKVREKQHRWQFWMRTNATLEPGWHFYWPLGIERVLTIVTAYDTLDLGPQSITTREGDSIVLRAYVSYVIFDARRAQLDCDGAESVLADIAPGCIEDLGRLTSWADIRSDEWRNTIKTHTQKQARRFGIGVRNVQFSDCTRSRSLRLFQEPTGSGE